MASWRYLLHGLHGAYLAELPLESVSFEIMLGGWGAGRFAAEVPLNDRRVRALNWRAATEPGETCVYVECDGELLGGWVVWDTIYHEATQRLSLAGNELWSYYMHRVLPLDRTFTAVDQLDIVRQLALDVVGEAGDLAIDVDAVGSGASGIVRTRTYPYHMAHLLGDVVDKLSKIVQGFDYRIALTRDDAGIHRRLVLGYPRLGRTLDVSGLKFAFPGSIATFDWPRQGSVRCTRAVATGAGTTRVQVLDRGAITAGAVLLDTVNAYANVSDETTLLGYAMATLGSHEGPAVAPTLVLRRTALPPLGTLDLGDDVLVEIEEAAYFPGPWDSPDGLDHRASMACRLVGLKVTPVGDKVELVLAGDIQPTSDDVIDGNGAPVTIPTPPPGGSLPGSGNPIGPIVGQQNNTPPAGGGGGGGQQMVNAVNFSVPGHGAQDVQSIAFTVPAGCAPCLTVIAFGSIFGSGGEATVELSIGGVTVSLVVTAGATWVPYCLINPINDQPAGAGVALLRVASGPADWHLQGQMQLWST
jgi:hypothetical protein